jgi:hypothetical protein
MPIPAFLAIMIMMMRWLAGPALRNVLNVFRSENARNVQIQVLHIEWIYQNPFRYAPAKYNSTILEMSNAKVQIFQKL